MGKMKVVGLWALQVILALLFVAPGWSKVTSHPGVIRMFQKFGYPDGFYWVVGVVELAGAAGLLIPPVTAYAAGALMCVMAGATYSHLAAGDPIGRVIQTSVSFLLLALVAWSRRPTFLRK